MDQDELIGFLQNLLFATVLGEPRLREPMNHVIM